MDTKQVLTEAYKLIKKGWIKESFHHVKRKHDCFCAVGAIRQAATGKVAIWTTEELTVVNPAVTALYKTLSPRGRAYDHSGAVIRWNDKKTTSKVDVLAAFRKAIAKVAA